MGGNSDGRVLDANIWEGIGENAQGGVSEGENLAIFTQWRGF